MSRYRVLWETLRVGMPAGILLAGVVGFAAIGRRDLPEGLPQTEPLPPLVMTVGVRAHETGMDLRTDGLVIPFRELTICAEVPGRVSFKSPACRTGRLVKQGDLLFEIDRQTYKIEVQRLEGELAQAEANLGQLDVELASTQRLVKLAEQQLALQQKNTERIEALIARSAGTMAGLDEARQSELTADHSLQTLKNQAELIAARRISLAKAAEIAAVKLQQAQIDLARTRITAAVDGIVLSDDVEENGYVQAGDPLVKLEDISAAEVRCNLRVEELQWIFRGCSAEKTASAPEGRLLPQTPVTCRYHLGDQVFEWEGVLDSYDGSGVDERTRTVPVRVLVPNPRAVPSSPGDGPRSIAGLMRGMYVEVLIHLEGGLGLMALPERVVQPGPVVWRVRDGQLQNVPISIAQVQGSVVLVEQRNSGLMPGDRVVDSPLNLPIDGMAVREERRE